MGHRVRVRLPLVLLAGILACEVVIDEEPPPRAEASEADTEGDTDGSTGQPEQVCSNPAVVAQIRDQNLAPTWASVRYQVGERGPWQTAICGLGDCAIWEGTDEVVFVQVTRGRCIQEQVALGGGGDRCGRLPTGLIFVLQDCE